MSPQIIIPEVGHHNKESKAFAYKDLSTVCIVPAIGNIQPKVVQAFRGIMSPMNQKFVMIMAEGMEVGAAYSLTLDQIFQHPELSKWKYLLTMETDNMPPADGLLKLLENMETYDAVGGLYFTKGHGGQPMCYGPPNVFPVTFAPFLPNPNTVQPCRGLGMGFTLFSMKMLRDKNLPRPLFETMQRKNRDGNMEGFTQDLKFFDNAGKLGYKFACDARVLVGHVDENGFVW